jgi:hypothetical protein
MKIVFLNKKYICGSYEKKILPFILLLFYGIGLVVISIDKWINDVNIDLTKAQKKVGTLKTAEVKNIKGFGKNGNAVRPVFALQFRNQKNYFAVYREYMGYQDLSASLKIGDTVTIYYRSSTKEYNLNVFQIQKGNQLIKSYKEYNESASSNGGIQLFLGMLIIAGAILWFKDFKLFRFLDKLAGRE